MPPGQPVAFFIYELQNGNQDNAQRIWDHFYRRLLPLVRKYLHQRVRRVIEEEDVAIRAMDQCFQQLQAEYVPSIKDRDNLWALLAIITERRALNANRDLMNQKPGGGNAGGLSVFTKLDDSVAGALEQSVAEMGALMAEDFDCLMKVLELDHQAVASLKLQGYSNREIAAKMQCAVVTVERKLNRIRKKWLKLDVTAASGEQE